jgi:adenylate cyclase
MSNDIPFRVLVVDDHRTNRTKLSMAVKNLGHKVELASDGQQALAMLHITSFALVLLDIIMPGLDGYAVLAHMKEDQRLKDIPVIVISAVDDMESVVKCIELGADDYLPKIFDPILLRARIGA